MASMADGASDCSAGESGESGESRPDGLAVMALARQEMEELRAEAEELREAVLEAADVSHQEREGVVAELTALKEALERAETEVRAARQGRDEAEENAERMKIALAELETSLAEESQRARSHSLAVQSDGETIMSLKQQNRLLREQLTEMEQLQNALAHDTEGTTTTLLRSDSLAAQPDKEAILSLKTQVNTLRSALQDERAEKEEHRAATASRVAEMEASLSSEQTNHAEARERLRAADEEIALLRVRADEASSSTEVVMKSLAELRTEHERVLAVEAEKSRKIAPDSSEDDLLRAYSKLLSESIVSRVASDIEKESTHRFWEQITESLRVSNASMKAELRDLREESERLHMLSGAAAEMTDAGDATTILRRLDKSIAALQRERALTSSLQQKLEAKTASVAEHENMIAQIDAERQHLMVTLETFQREHGELTDTVERLQDLHGSNAALLDEMRVSLEDARASALSAREEATSLAQEVEEMQAIRVNMVRNFDNLLSENVELVETINKLRAEVTAGSPAGSLSAGIDMRVAPPPPQPPAASYAHAPEEVQSQTPNGAHEQHDNVLRSSTHDKTSSSPQNDPADSSRSAVPPVDGDASNTMSSSLSVDVDAEASSEEEEETEYADYEDEPSASMWSSIYRVGIFGFIAGSDKIEA